MSDSTYDQDVEQENQRMREELARMHDWCERKGLPPGDLASRVATFINALGNEAAQAERFAEVSRDQARVATRERDALSARNAELVAQVDREVAEVEKARAGRNAIREERDAAQDQCAMHQRAHNEAALMLERFRSHLGRHVSGDSAAFDLCAEYDASVRTDAPPPVDWEKRAKEAESERDKAVAVMEAAQGHAKLNLAVRREAEEQLRLALAVVEAARPYALEALTHVVVGRMTDACLDAAITAHDTGPTAPVVPILQRLNAAEAVVDVARASIASGVYQPLERALATHDAAKAPTHPALGPVAVECEHGYDVCPKCDGVKS